MGETRVNLVHLLEDLRDAYPGSIEETIVTEMVANALDSGAGRISLFADPVAATLTVTDDGSGMTRAALTRYHDLASTTKRRGRSIGFAGVGIKLGLLISDDVVTESRGKRTHLATSWRLTAKNRAPWRWIELPGMVAAEAGPPEPRATGTAVRLYLSEPLSPLLDRGFLENTLVTHFRPLLDPTFDEVLESAYPDGVRFSLNQREIPRTVADPGRVPIRVRLGRQRKPSGVGYVSQSTRGEGEGDGIAISTMGKVVLKGWDWLGLAPPESVPVTGLIEVPALVEVLQLNKADFIKTGKKGATFLAYRQAIQEPVARILTELGDSPTPKSRRPRTRALERDLQSVLAELTESFPLVGTLVRRRPGGQVRLPLGEPGGSEDGMEAVARPTPGDEAPGTKTSDGPAVPPGPRDAHVPDGKGRRRPATYGLSVRFESRPRDLNPGRLVESTIWINEDFPAYRRALASRSEGYHIALTVALALAPLVAETRGGTEFVTTFMARWGEVGLR